MIVTGACAVHCRYCFRRHYAYGEDPKRLDDWEPAFQVLREDDSIHELILSGGDGVGKARIGFKREVLSALINLTTLHDLP